MISGWDSFAVCVALVLGIPFVYLVVRHLVIPEIIRAIRKRQTPDDGERTPEGRDDEN